MLCLWFLSEGFIPVKMVISGSLPVGFRKKLCASAQWLLKNIRGSEDSGVCSEGHCENLRIYISLSVLIGHGWKGRERTTQWEEHENFRIGLQEKVECHDQNVWVFEAI